MRTGASLSALFAPRTVAVVGASASPGKAGNAMMRSLLSFPGSLYPINPRASEVEGHRAYPRVSEIPEAVDLAVLVVPPRSVPDALRDCAEAGVRAAVVCSGGMGESGPEGAALQKEALGIAWEFDLRVLGPNTSGFINPVAGVVASFVPGAGNVRAGNIAIVAQSGGVNHALAFAAQNEELGVRLAVGLGNAMDVTAADVLEHLADDEGTRAIALHVEGIPDGRALFEAVERTVERKPVVALKVGRADVSDFARSHTGALTGSWRLARSALSQAGAVVVESTTELLDAAHALSVARLPPREQPGIALVSGQAGPALIIADALRTAGVALPELSPRTTSRLGELLPPLTYQRNPVDTGRPGEFFAEVLATVGSDPSVDAVIVYALSEPTALDPVAAVEKARGLSEMPPVVFATGGPREALKTAVEALEASRVPAFSAPERGALAARALAVDARAAFRKRGRSEEPLQEPPPLGPEPLDEAAAKDVLDAMGIRTPSRRVATSREEARAAWTELGEEAVVKVLDPTVAHKSEVGGVHVGVSSPEALEAALDAIDDLSGSSRRRYLIEEMAAPGVELILGGTRDLAFGPKVLLGLGGVTAEALGDISLRLAPLSARDAHEMIEELSSKKLLEGFRGGPVAKRAELVGALLAVGRLLVARPVISELDINPLRVTESGLVALDALILTSTCV